MIGDTLEEIILKENRKNPRYSEINNKYAFSISLGETKEKVNVTLGLLLKNEHTLGRHQIFLVADILKFRDKIEIILNEWKK